MSEIREIVLTHAVNDATEVQKFERQMVDAQEEVRDLQVRVAQMERRYRTLDYPGKNQGVRDAQMEADMAQDEALVGVRSILRSAEMALAYLRVERDEFERFYKAATAFLRGAGE